MKASNFDAKSIILIAFMVGAMLSMMLLPLVCRHPPISALPHYSNNHTYLIPIVPQKRKQLSIYRLLKEDHRNGLDGGGGEWCNKSVGG